jgi:hypothetical protein
LELIKKRKENEHPKRKHNARKKQPAHNFTQYFIFCRPPLTPKEKTKDGNWKNKNDIRKIDPHPSQQQKPYGTHERQNIKDE